MICHYAYQRAADAPVQEGYFSLESTQDMQVSGAIYRRFNIQWQMLGEQTVTTFTPMAGRFPNLVVTINVPLPKEAKLLPSPFGLLAGGK
jgi:hypothetical protein